MNPAPFNPTDTDLERLDNELAPVQRTTDPMTLVQIALEQGRDPNAILDFIERANAMKAAERFAEAIARFQAECPQILKERSVSFKAGTAYKFASYDDINKAIAPLLKDCGIVVTFSIETDLQNGLLRGTCFVRVGSHCVPTTMPIPIAKGMNTNDAQNFGGTITYLKRYLICLALNIVVTDELEADRDGVQFVTPDDIAALNTLITKTNTDPKRFLKWADCDSLAELPKSKFGQAVAMLGEKVKA